MKYLAWLGAALLVLVVGAASYVYYGLSHRPDIDAYNSFKTFNKASIFFDYGLGDAGYAAMPSTRTYYFDDLKFTP